jgi:uncharacterized protein (DUF2147 family)
VKRKNLIMKHFLAIPGLLLLLAAHAKGQPTDPAAAITGIYWAPKKDAKIMLFRKGTKFFGKTVWLANPGKDEKNPAASLRQRDLLGLELLSNFTFDDGVYTGGKIYDPESGKTYDCKITMKGDALKVRGYIGISLLGRTEVFTRVK